MHMTDKQKKKLLRNILKIKNNKKCEFVRMSV